MVQLSIPDHGSYLGLCTNVTSGTIVIISSLNWLHGVARGEIYPNPSVASRGIEAASLNAGRGTYRFGHHHRPLGIALYRLLRGLCFSAPWAVPSPKSPRCARVFRLVIATNPGISRPGAVVALALNPNLPMMASMAAEMAFTWQHIFVYLVSSGIAH